MRVIMFQDRFAELVRSGEKKQTIRKSCYGIQPGTVLSLRRWTGKPYRSKQEVLREAVCVEAEDISIINSGIVLGRDSTMVRLDTTYGPNLLEKIQTTKILGDLARADGFASWPEMRDWFEKVHGLPFDGYLIRWG